jgi:hypothetical protein
VIGVNLYALLFAPPEALLETQPADTKSAPAAKPAAASKPAATKASGKSKKK